MRSTVGFGRPLVLALLLAGTAHAGTRTDLRGHVLDEKGAPLRGATVSVYTAAPRTGVGTLCPSCYADCGKSTMSDAQGAFTLASVDDSLVFRVLAVAPGRTPRFADRVDPRMGPIIIRMSPRDTTALDPRRTSRGVVIGADGRPAVGAIVEGLGLTNGVWESFGDIRGLDPLSVCDQDGAFLLALPDTGVAPIVRVRSRDHATRFVSDLPIPPARGRIVLTRGAIVEGVVMRDGRPAPGVTVVVGGDGNEVVDGGVTRPDSIATDALGRYRFQGLPPHRAFRLSAAMGSLPAAGATRHVSVTAGDPDSVALAPPLVIEQGRTLKGRVRLTDGKPLPAGGRITLRCGDDRRTLELAADGSFTATGLPPEEITVVTGAPGYRLSSLLDPVLPRRGDQFTIGMTRDRTVEIPLEPRPPMTPPPAPRPGAR